VGLILLCRPWRAPGPAPALHAALWAIAAAMAIQLVPLPEAIVDRLSPSGRDVWQALSLMPVQGALPLSVDLTSTVSALFIGGGAMTVFAISRQVFTAGGVRMAARGIASVGLALAAVSLAQDATAHGLIYWRWHPGEGPRPFGPFLNRNHFASWIVMAVPICLGYLLAHAAAHHRREAATPTWRHRLLAALDARSIWLATAICLMLVALVASLSRAGMVGLAAALAAGWYLRSRRSNAPAVSWGIGAVGVALIAAAVRVDLSDMLQRFGSAGTAAAYRLGIWRATMRVVEDFWLTGTGAGTLETVMLVYQRTPSLFRINAAENHYLQVAAEGGLLIGIPVIAALVLFVRESLAALADDDSGMYFLRAGALSGLFGLAVQSVWETSLATPANGVLAAIAAAIVVHQSAPRARSDD
jgi:hypothetical protein